MRCGTTTLWEVLRSNHRVFLPQTKEIHFFDNRDGTWEKGVGTYLSHFTAARDDQVCGEVTPCYMFYEEACQRIRSVLPNVRLVAILRDPVKRAWSHYWYAVRRGYEALGFTQALERENDRLSSGDYYARNRYSYVARGKYFDQLKRFGDAFPVDRLHVVFLEDLRRRPQEAIAALCRHLAVPLTPELGGLSKKNGGVHPRLRRLHWLTEQWRDRVGASMGLHGRIARLLIRVLRAMNVREGIPPIHPTLERRLADTFRESDERLEAWLGRSLPWRDQQ